MTYRLLKAKLYLDSWSNVFCDIFTLGDLHSTSKYISPDELNIIMSYLFVRVFIDNFFSTEIRLLGYFFSRIKY